MYFGRNEFGAMKSYSNNYDSDCFYFKGFAEEKEMGVMFVGWMCVGLEVDCSVAFARPRL